MLEEVILDEVERISASNQPIFDANIDYNKVLEDQNNVSAAWRTLPQIEKESFKSQREYELQQGARDPRRALLRKSGKRRGQPSVLL